MNNENRLINYWAHMLDESSGIDLSNVEGSMTKVINDQIMDKLEACKTVQQVYDLVKNTFDANDINTVASRRLLYHIQRSGGVTNAMMTVHNSRMEGMNLGVNGPRRRRIYERNDVKIVPDDDYDAETDYNLSLPPFQRKQLVRQSEVGLDLANGIYRREQILNPEMIPEAKHSMRGPA